MHKDALLLETGRSSSLSSIIHVKYQEERSFLARKWQQTHVPKDHYGIQIQTDHHGLLLFKIEVILKNLTPFSPPVYFVRVHARTLFTSDYEQWSETLFPN